MLGNLINGEDLRWVATRLPLRLGSLLRRLFVSGRQRTRDLYSQPPATDQWWGIPAIQRRWNRLVTGDPDIDHHQYLADKYLGRGDLAGLSVGCGNGRRELRWAQTGRFTRLLGVDLTEAPLAEARRGAESAGLSPVLEFRLGDLADPVFCSEGGFDVVIGEHAIHHLSPLEEILIGLRERMVPGGLFLMNEFVGPTRFQWTDAQVRCAEALLGQVPEALRITQEGRIKRRIGRPSLLYMRLKDPSEAVESARILPLMDELFQRVELRAYGGTVLHILLDGIAHHFHDQGEVAMESLQSMFEAEDRLLESGELPSDFVVGVYRKRR